MLHLICGACRLPASLMQPGQSSTLAWRRAAPHPPTNQPPNQPANPSPPGKLVFVSHAAPLNEKDTLTSFFGLAPTDLPALVGFEAAKNRKYRLELDDGAQLT